MWHGKIIVLKLDDESELLLDRILSALSDVQYQLMEVATTFGISFPGLEIDFVAKRVLRDGLEVSLTYYEYHVLCYLARHAGCILSKKQIYEAIWHEAADIGCHTVETIIYQLRRKLEPDPANPLYIKTVIGHGYKIEKTNGQL